MICVFNINSYGCHLQPIRSPIYTGFPCGGMCGKKGGQVRNLALFFRWTLRDALSDCAVGSSWAVGSRFCSRETAAELER